MPPTKTLMEDKRLFLVLSPEKALVFHKGSEKRRATCGPERQRASCTVSRVSLLEESMH